jgi:exopolysaccharide production protein ExoY
MTMNAFDDAQSRRRRLGAPRAGSGTAVLSVDAGSGGVQTDGVLDFATGGSLASELSRPLGGLTKRTTDIVVALAGLLLAAPVMLFVALLIKATSPGPVIFAHGRVGFGGRSFNCYKFRTMVTDADRRLAEHLARDPEAAREWSEARKLRRDPRITLIGRMLRKSSLDELPQLFNILRGDMSCVGPRPIVHDELEHYGTCAGEYLQTRPGLTGLWQVTGRSNTDYSIRVSLDSHYVRNWSLTTDAFILVRTVFAVMRFNEVC